MEHSKVNITFNQITHLFFQHLIKSNSVFNQFSNFFVQTNHLSLPDFHASVVGEGRDLHISMGGNANEKEIFLSNNAMCKLGEDDAFSLTFFGLSIQGYTGHAYLHYNNVVKLHNFTNRR